jgi:hypothetical protein
VHSASDKNSGILGASSASANDDKDSDPKDDAFGGLSNTNIKSKDEIESEPINLGKLKTGLPPTLNIPMIPSMTVPEGQVPNNTSIQQGTIDAPAPVPTASDAPQVAASISSSVTPSNCTHPPVNTSSSKSYKKAKPGKSVKTKNSTNH